MICVDARNEIFEHVELFGLPAIFTNARVDRPTVPEGLFCYDIRGSDDDPGALCMIENHVCVNHAGTVIGTVDYLLGKDGYKVIGEGINFLGDEITLYDFCKLHGIEIGEPKKGVLDTLRENKIMAAKQGVRSISSKEQAR